MKDLRFYGEINSTEVDITYRTDLINPSSENFSVSQIQVGEQFESSDEKDSDHARIFGEFKRLSYNLTTFKNFAIENNINLTISDSTGANLEFLVEEDESVS